MNKLLKNREKGFTIIEILAIIVILGIISTLTFTIYSFAINSLEQGRLQTELQREVRLVDYIIRNELRFINDLQKEIETSEEDEYYKIKFAENRLSFSDDRQLVFDYISDISFKLRKTEDEKVFLSYEINSSKASVNLSKQILLDNISSDDISLDFAETYQELFYK